jgi:hypothetical protein
MGAAKHLAFPAPSHFFEGARSNHSGTFVPRECEHLLRGVGWTKRSVPTVERAVLWRGMPNYRRANAKGGVFFGTGGGDIAGSFGE